MSSKRPIIIGLTGGIGCGKSTATRYFESINVPVCDADAISHQITKPGQPVLTEIARFFGTDVISNSGELDRQHLKKIVFRDSEKLQQLEQLLHPLIREQIDQWISIQTAPYIILAIPLLFEKGWQSIVDRTLVIDIPVETQIKRVQKRDGTDIAIINNIIQKQISRDKRLALADDIVDNTQSETDLYQQLEQLHQFYLSLNN